MMTELKRGVGALVLGLATVPGVAWAQQNAAGDLPGPIDSLQDLQDTGKLIFKAADANNDGQISQREALDAGNLLVGGFFFRADANGDGTVSKQEWQQAREMFLAQRPILKAVVERAKTAPAVANATNNATPEQTALSLLDTNGDGQVQATELRQLVQTTIQGAFGAADINSDGQLSPSELNAAVVGAARGVQQAAFRKADTDNNGQISRAEFDQALIGPANVLFQVVDANGDGQLSPQEANNAAAILASQIRKLNVPEPANSARHLMQSGMRPAQVAPVPNVNATNARPVVPAR